MSPHPEADAFVRGFLRNPADETTRLVFADWLDDTGDPKNATWAAFIRARAAADRHPPDSGPRHHLDRQAADLAADVSAELTLPADQFIRQADALLKVFPEPNISLRLAGHRVPRSVIELVPESVARENLVLPLALEGNRLVVAAADPGCLDTFDKLEFILNKTVVMVGAAEVDVVAAINQHFGQTETESVDCVLYESPRVGSRGDRDWWLIGDFLHQAFERPGVTGFELADATDGCLVVYNHQDGRVSGGGIGDVAFRRLLDRLTALPAANRVVVGGSLRREVDVPLLSDRRFPIDFDIREGERPPRWLRVTFRWERAAPEPRRRRRRR